MNNLVDSILVMRADVYSQSEIQDEDTGALKKEWSYSHTVPCHAKGIISNSGSSRSGDRQMIGSKYINEQVIEFRTESKITYRHKISNVRDSNDQVIWKELNFPTETPTVFEVTSSTPIVDPFGTILGYNSVLKRSENQIIGI